jgi:hypothetical protein
MTDVEKLRLCRGCRDDFYNRKNPQNIWRCWSFAKAYPVIRWKIETWTQPTRPGAFTEVYTLSCHRGDGYTLNKVLPNCAIEPVKLKILPWYDAAVIDRATGGTRASYTHVEWDKNDTRVTISRREVDDEEL